MTTMSSSKGLEFDVVVMVGIEDGKIPFFSSTGAALEEDRRKFYVSLTRARHAVHIFYSGWFQWRAAARSTTTARAGSCARLALPKSLAATRSESSTARVKAERTLGR